ncbi:MAG: nitrilase-related carbon-nitrogen hydrolase [Halanaerobiales bacterium]
MYQVAVFESLSDNSVKNNIRQIRDVIPEMEIKPELALIQNYPVIRYYNNSGNQLDIPRIKEDYFELISSAAELASELSIYLCPGILLEVEAENIYFSSILINPLGEIILKQRQIYINSESDPRVKPEKVKDGNIKNGSIINYAETELGKIGLILDRDCWHPGIGRVMSLENVDIVLAVNKINGNRNSINKNYSGNLASDVYTAVAGNPWKQLAGVWSQVQQNQFFAVEASVGGQNLIHAPCEITPCRTGILAPVGTEESAKVKSIEPYFEEISSMFKSVDDYKIITTEIDLNKLKSIRSSYPLFKYLNKPLYCNEMWGGACAGSSQE